VRQCGEAMEAHFAGRISFRERYATAARSRSPPLLFCPVAVSPTSPEHRQKLRVS